MSFSDARRLKFALGGLLRTACLIFLNVSVAAAQTAEPTAQLSGRVLDREQGTPIGMATVRITSLHAGASHAVFTDSAGRFSFALAHDEVGFSLRAERIGYLPLTVTIPADEASDGFVWRDIRLASSSLALPGLSVEGRRRQETPARTPGGNEQVRVSWLNTSVPLDPGDLGGLAALHSGVREADGGLSFFAQDPSQSRITVDGATFGATSIPQEAIASTSVAGSTYDVARGQFSGGVVSARTMSGTNLFGGALRVRASQPLAQFHPSGAAGARSPSQLGHLDGGAGGAVVQNRLFWFAAGSATFRLTPLLSLENAGPAVLGALGVDPDSAAQLARILQESGATPPTVVDRRQVLSGGASGLVRLDYELAHAHQLTLRIDGQWNRIEGLGLDPLASRSTLGTARHRNGGALAQITSGFGPIDTDFRVYFAEARRVVSADHPGPAGIVRVGSSGAGMDGTSVLRFGGALFQADSERSILEVSTDATATLGPEHQLKAGFVFSHEGGGVLAPGNHFGTFGFHDLNDFRAGRPAFFTRTLGGSAAKARSAHSALYLGDTWRRGRVGVTGGVRLEGRWYPTAAAEAAPRIPFGMEPGRVPPDWGVSPRLGWSYTSSGWSLHGGVGEFRGALAIEPLAAALGQTGADGDLVLTCVGAEAPAPEWSRYAADPQTIPRECATGASVFSTRAPVATGFASDFAAPRVRRASLGGTFPLLDRFRVNAEAVALRASNHAVATDLNLPETPEFFLAAEGGRPVYAAASSINPTTGGVATGASRPFPEWGSLREISGSGHSSAVQARVDVSLFSPSGLRARSVRVSGGYALTRAWNHVGGVHALDGSRPFATSAGELTWGRSDLEQRHDLQIRLSQSPAAWARFGVLARLRSGLPFTPRVDGDVNGDGTANDPAFVFDPTLVRDSALAAGMARLLESVPRGVRQCLERQVGSVATRNSCTGGWWSSLDARADLRFWRNGPSRRLHVTITTTNALTLVDRVVNRRSGMRGWGEPPRVDPVLLRVRGFDPLDRAFLYEVNPTFGSRDAARSRTGRPFALMIAGRVTVGRDPAYQPLERLVNRTVGAGRSPEEIRHGLSERIPNVPLQVMGFDSAAGLRLTLEQRQQLTEQAEAQSAQLAPLADSLSTVASDLEQRRRSAREARREIDVLTSRIRSVLDAGIGSVREILSEEQWDRLPALVRNPSRQILPPPGLPAPVIIGG